MAANTHPVFIKTPRTWSVSIATAETSLTSPTNVGTLVTAGADGSLVEAVRIKAAATTTAGMIRFWIYDGSSYFLYSEVKVTAIAPNATTESFETTWAPPGKLSLGSGQSLRVTTEKSETFKLTAMGGDF